MQKKYSNEILSSNRGCFKLNSKYNRRFQEILKCNGYSYVGGPNLVFDLGMDVSGSIVEKKFHDSDGTYYGYLTADYNFKQPEHVEDLKVSVYYKKLEDLTSEMTVNRQI